MLVHAARKYRTERKLKIHTIHKLNTTQQKQTIHSIAKQNYPGLVAFYDTWPGNKLGLFYDASKHKWGLVVRLQYSRWLADHIYRPGSSPVSGAII